MGEDRPAATAPVDGSRYGPPLGAIPGGDGTTFRVWAPSADTVEVLIEPTGASTPLQRGDDGVHHAFVPGVRAGARYRLRLDGEDAFPDPASRRQPEGVHGPSEVVDPRAYRWRDEGWGGVPRSELVFYELHVGTFTERGDFAGVRERLDHLRELGVTAIELMPIADFPGRWNWGYDPAALFAPSRAYGSPDDLRRLVDEAHAAGLAVYLDVVHNHLGPDGAYLPVFAGTFFTDRHATPWGSAVNLDGEGSAGVRRFLIQNALHWLEEYHLDGLRLDATHALIDDGDPHFLAELSAAVRDLPGPRRVLVAEDHRNLRTLVEPREAGGYGLDAVWADDFHHQMRRITAGDAEGYYADFTGGAADLARTLEQGWLFTGQHSPHQGGPRGTGTEGLGPERFVLCIQNHDQVGNRAQGDRLSHEVPPGAYLAATAILLFAPQLPLLFMGQEWATARPFQYFTDHRGDLGTRVSEGRKAEFAAFRRFAGEDVPDPQDPSTFRRSVLDWEEPDRPHHARILRAYRDLLALRRRVMGGTRATSPAADAVALRRGRHLLVAALTGGVRLRVPTGTVRWRSDDAAYTDRPGSTILDGGTARFDAPGALVIEEPS